MREIDEGVDGVTDGEAGCAGRQRLDESGNFVAGNGGESGRTVGVLVGLVPGEFGGGDGGSVDADEGVAGGEEGLRSVFIDELFGPSAGMQANRFHGGQSPF